MLAVQHQPAGSVTVPSVSVPWCVGVEAAEGAGHRVLRSEPSSGEADLSYAWLSDLLNELLPVVRDTIPAPQRDALEVALLLREAGDRPPWAIQPECALIGLAQAALADRRLPALAGRRIG